MHLSATSTTEPPSWPLTINAEMFAIAEELGIHALKALAMRKTEQVMVKRIWWKDFGRAVRIIYTSTPSKEQSIRDLYVRRFCGGKANLLRWKDFEAEERAADIIATGQFLMDVLRAES